MYPYKWICQAPDMILWATICKYAYGQNEINQSYTTFNIFTTSYSYFQLNNTATTRVNNTTIIMRCCYKTIGVVKWYKMRIHLLWAVQYIQHDNSKNCLNSPFFSERFIQQLAKILSCNGLASNRRQVII